MCNNMEGPLVLGSNFFLVLYVLKSKHKLYGNISSAHVVSNISPMAHLSLLAFISSNLLPWCFFKTPWPTGSRLLHRSERSPPAALGRCRRCPPLILLCIWHISLHSLPAPPHGVQGLPLTLNAHLRCPWPAPSCLRGPPP